MPTIPGRFDSYKLDTEFGDGYCIHTRTTPESEDMRGTWRDDLKIGQGGFGSVFRQKKEGDATFRAVKKVFKKDIKWNERELLALTKLRVYPRHFVKFFGWFEDEVHETIYFAMEYARYGDLERYINGSEMPVPEYDVKTITAQILEGLVIMHRENICHRDLKPQNILVVSRSPDPIWVKITDFGVSKQAGENTQLRTEVGTCNYTAPEVLGYLSRDTSVYTSAVDIWSLGCLVYTIMTKESPFSTKGIIKYISNEILPEEKLTERYASSDVIEFITKLLKPQPYDRLSAEDALKDRWISANIGELYPTGPPGICVEKVSSGGSSLSSGASGEDSRPERLVSLTSQQKLLVN